MTQTATKSCQTFVFNLTAALSQNSVERLASGRFADDAFSERSQRIDGPGRVEQILPQVRDPPVDFGRPSRQALRRRSERATPAGRVRKPASLCSLVHSTGSRTSAWVTGRSGGTEANLDRPQSIDRLTINSLEGNGKTPVKSRAENPIRRDQSE